MEILNNICIYTIYVHNIRIYFRFYIKKGSGSQKARMIFYCVKLFILHVIDFRVTFMYIQYMKQPLTKRPYIILFRKYIEKRIFRVVDKYYLLNRNLLLYNKW